MQMAAGTTPATIAEDTTAGAASHDQDWHQIDWYKVQRDVRRLQRRIAKARQDGRRGKMKALQRLLTHSFSGKALAVRRVTENHGKRTPGVDGVTWDTPAQKATAMRELRQRGYRPHPLRRTSIPKANGKMRPLGIPTMKDRAMQALYLLALNPVAETTADPSSYGFRLERCPADALVFLHTVLSNAQGAPGWVLEGDITSCFDRISHDWLLAHVPMDKGILKTWLKAGFMEKHVLYRTEEGAPQGGIISPVLANLALDGLAALLKERFPRRKDGSSPMVNLVRYADDFVVTGDSHDLLEHEVKPLVKCFMRERGLELSHEKTLITRIEDGFDFLGQTVRKYPNGQVLTVPSKKNVQAFLEKVRGIIEKNKALDAGTLVLLLNPIIDGWARYHAFGASKQTFNSVDHAIHKKLWRWIRRRHPHKSATWRKAKYFPPHGPDNWRFSGEVKDQAGKPYLVKLHRAADMPIKRHVAIRKEANPFDPAWETYFEARLDVKMERNLLGKRRLLALWMEQGGRCPHCGHKITTLTGWHSHPIVWRSKGGSDGQDNRVLLHPTCHMQVHSRGVIVAKPPHIRGVRKA
jgi:RNA-directed DNA polymerase